MNTDIYGETSYDVSDAIIISTSGPAKCESFFRDEEFLVKLISRISVLEASR